MKKKMKSELKIFQQQHVLHSNECQWLAEGREDWKWFETNILLLTLSSFSQSFVIHVSTG